MADLAIKSVRDKGGCDWFVFYWEGRVHEPLLMVRPRELQKALNRDGHELSRLEE